nr:beta/gamma crystallin domain-containing protein 1-like [Lepeophtheirus salmonis]
MKVLLSLTILVGISLGAQDIRLFSETNLQGTSKIVARNEEDLQLIGFNNKAKSAYLYGIWLLYEEIDFNRGNYNKMVSYVWGRNVQISTLGEINGKVSSTRYSGVDDLFANTINFYEGPGFMGIEQSVQRDSPKLNYDNFGKSIIITGCKPWTLYEKENFGGKKICVYPNLSSTPCKPGFLEKPSAFGNFADQVSSVRLGCFSKSSFVAKPFIEGKSKSINLFDN